MDYNQAYQTILTWITDNNNKEITAAIMRDVLNTLLDFADENIGDTSILFDKDNTVDAINELKNIVDNINISQPLVVHNGSDNPNVNPPFNFNAPDIYVRVDELLKTVYMYNGTRWVEILTFKIPTRKDGLWLGNVSSLNFVGAEWQLTFDPVTGQLTMGIVGGVGQVDSVRGTIGEIDVDDSDPTSPIVGLAQAVKDSLALADTAVQPLEIADFITETDVISTLRSFSKPQWLDVAVLTPVSNVFTPDLGVSGSFTADLAANSTLANPTIPSGYDSGKVLAWDITFTITGAGGWTLAFGNQYFVDADVDIAAIIADNNTTGDVIQLFFQFKNNAISVQPFIPTAI